MKLSANEALPEGHGLTGRAIRSRQACISNDYIADQRVEALQRSVAFLLPHELRTPLTVIIGGSEMLNELRNGADMDHALSDNYIGKYRGLADLEQSWQGAI